MGVMSPAEEQILIRANVPKAVEPDLKNLTTMEEVQEVLECEYGQVRELSHEVMTGLVKFQYLSASKTEGQKFMELQWQWKSYSGPGRSWSLAELKQCHGD